MNWSTLTPAWDENFNVGPEAFKRELKSPFDYPMPKMRQAKMSYFFDTDRGTPYSRMAINAMLDEKLEMNKVVKYGNVKNKNILFLITEKYIYGDLNGRIYKKRNKEAV